MKISYELSMKHPSSILHNSNLNCLIWSQLTSVKSQSYFSWTILSWLNLNFSILDSCDVTKFSSNRLYHNDMLQIQPKLVDEKSSKSPNLKWTHVLSL